MYTATHTLSLPDGRSVSASITVESPESETLPTYQGEVGLIDWDPTRLFDDAFLNFKMKKLATQLGGTLETMEEGTYDRWAL